MQTTLTQLKNGQENKSKCKYGQANADDFDMELISVVIPTYNTGHLISDAVESVLNQSYRRVEVVVVDDGSTDNTRQVVAAISDKDPRVNYVYQENKGLGGARNTGIYRARGDYLAFLDADDVFLPSKLKIQANMLDANPDLGLVAGGHRVVDIDTGLALGERQPWQHRPDLNLNTWLVACPIVPCAALMRTSWARKVNGFQILNPPGAEDRDMWLRLSHAGCRMAWTTEIVCAYRMHSGQMTRNGKKQSDSTLLALDRFFSQPDVRPEALAVRDRAYADAYVSGAFREYGSNQIEEARLMLKRALERLPHLMQSNEGNLPPLAYTIVAWAMDPVNGDPSNYAERVLNNLPNTASSLTRYRDEIIGIAATWAAMDALSVNNPDLARRHLDNVVQQMPLLCTEYDYLLDPMIDYVQQLPEGRQIHLVEQFFEVLPTEVPVFEVDRDKAIARLYLARAFRANAADERHAAYEYVRRGIEHDKSWLRNRGVLSILWKGWRS